MKKLLKYIALIFVGLVVLGVIGNAGDAGSRSAVPASGGQATSSPQPDAAPAGTATPQAGVHLTRAEVHATTVAHAQATSRTHAAVIARARAAARGRAVARARAIAQARATQTATAALQAARAAAQAARRQQQRADLRTFYAAVLSVTNPCSDAAKTSASDVQAVADGTGDEVTAYQDAQAWVDACRPAVISMPSVPDDLSGLGLDEATTDLGMWAVDEQNAAQDMEKVLQDNNDVADAADAKNQANDAQTQLFAGTARIVTAAQQIGVSLDGVQPS